MSKFCIFSLNDRVPSNKLGQLHTSPISSEFFSRTLLHWSRESLSAVFTSNVKIAVEYKTAFPQTRNAKNTPDLKCADSLSFPKVVSGTMTRVI